MAPAASIPDGWAERGPDRVVARPASPVLASRLIGIGYHRAEPRERRELVLPTGCMHLVVNLARDRMRWYTGDDFERVHVRSGAVLVAAESGPLCLDLADQRSVLAVMFRPGGAHPFLHAPASALDEPLVDLEALWGRDSGTLRERLLHAPTLQAAQSALESCLIGHAGPRLEPDPAITVAVTALDGGVAVKDVAGRLGLSDRTLLRRFREHVGMTPKRFSRVRRLQRLLGSIPVDREADWAQMAADHGYFDQAHLSNEFRALTGMTPGAYRPRTAGTGHGRSRHHARLPA